MVVGVEPGIIDDQCDGLSPGRCRLMGVPQSDDLSGVRAYRFEQRVDMITNCDETGNLCLAS